MKSLNRLRRHHGFTLVELLVSSAIVVMMLGFLLVTVDQTRRTVNNTTAKVGQFQAARVAFDSMTRNLSQATLNTYYDLDFDKNANPIRYHRQADLHFVIDEPSVFLNGTNPYNSAPGGAARFPGQGVFFQAPIGLTAELQNSNRRYRSLSNLLSVVGYYVEWNEDTALPDFIKTNPLLSKKRYRYRLMELIQPAEENMVYNNSNYTTVPTMATSPAQPYTSPRDWINVALGLKPLTTGLPLADAGKSISSSRMLAENIVALIIVPKLSQKDRLPNRLDELTGSGDVYDTRISSAYANQARQAPLSDTTTGMQPYQLKQMHQLPPILQVTMVAIDEASAIKLQDYSTSPPAWMTSLFKKFTTDDAFSAELGETSPPKPSSLVGMMTNIDGSQPTPRMNYRVFTTDVVMRGSKWTK